MAQATKGTAQRTGNWSSLCPRCSGPVLTALNNQGEFTPPAVFSLHEQAEPHDDQQNMFRRSRLGLLVLAPLLVSAVNSSLFPMVPTSRFFLEQALATVFTAIRSVS